MIKQWISGGWKAISSTFRRFPGTVAASLLTAAAFIYKTEASPYLSGVWEDELRRIIMILALGIPLMLCVALLYERISDPEKAANPFVRSVAYLAGMAGLAGYYFLLLSDTRPTSVIRYFMVTAVLYLAALAIPYITGKRENFEVFGAVLLGRAFLTALYGLVMSLGITAILFAIDKLLVTNMNKNYYIYVWLLAVTVFTPLFFLFGVPERGAGQTPNDYPKLLRVLLVYVVLPLLSAYTIVLLLYFGQIIAFARWPKGIISYLVLYYAGISVAMLFLALPFRDSNRWVRLFCFLLPKVMILPLGMMFAAIGMRVRDYGITESRYYILLLGLWALGAVVYLNFPRRRTTLLPVSLAAVLLLSVFGPWDAFSVSRTSQSVRLGFYLEKNAMLQDGKVVRKPEIPDKDKNEISSILYYLEGTHGLGHLAYLPQGFTTSEMEKVFGFSYAYVPPKGEAAYFYYGKPGSSAFDIAGYDAQFNIYDYYIYKDRSLTHKPLEAGGFAVDVDGKVDRIKVYEGQDVVYEFDLVTYIDRLYKKFGANQEGPQWADLTVEEESQKVAARLVFRNINGTYAESTGKYEITNVEVTLLLKRK